MSLLACDVTCLCKDIILAMSLSEDISIVFYLCEDIYIMMSLFEDIMIVMCLCEVISIFVRTSVL